MAGSPGRPAPRETNQISARRGSIDAIIDGRIPSLVLFSDRSVLGVATVGLALRAPDALQISLVCDLAQQGGNRNAPIGGLLGEKVPGGPRDADGGCLGRQILSPGPGTPKRMF